MSISKRPEGFGTAIATTEFRSLQLPPPTRDARQRPASSYDSTVLEPPAGDDWIGLSDEPLPVAEALAYAVVPGCGGLVIFCGTVRDFSEGRDAVSTLEYEAYSEQVGPRLAALARSTRERWPEIGRIVLLHRVGRLQVCEPAVVVCASTPHRSEAFAVTRHLIDTLKSTIPIWKRETWAEGSEWSEETCEITDVTPGSCADSSENHHRYAETRLNLGSIGGDEREAVRSRIR